MKTQKKVFKTTILGLVILLTSLIFLTSTINRLTIGTWNPLYVPEARHFQMLQGRLSHLFGRRPAVQRIVVWPDELEIVCSPKYHLIDSMEVIINPEAHRSNYYHRDLILMAATLNPQIKIGMASLLDKYHFTEIQGMVKDLPDSEDLYENVLMTGDPQMDEAIPVFAKAYWDEFFASFYSMIAVPVCQSADALAENLAADFAPFLREMEKTTGLDFPETAKVIAYPSWFIAPGAAAHSTKNGYIVIYAGTIQEPRRFIDTAIHELTHFLIEPEMGKILPTLSPLFAQDTEFLARWSQSAANYSWEGWLEENVVNALEQAISVRLRIKEVEEADAYLHAITPFSRRLFHEFLQTLPEEPGEGQVVEIVLNAAREGVKW